MMEKDSSAATNRGPTTADTTLAMAMCIRNEARFLEANLRYHYAVGVRKCYLFLDRCTDHCDQIAAAFPWVQRILIDPADSSRFAYITDFMTACMDHALQLARQDEFAWLLTIDADEFAFADLPEEEESPFSAGDLSQLLRGVDASVDMIQLQTKELVPCASEDERPFWKQHFFLIDEDFSRTLFDPLDNRKFEWRGFLSHNQGKSIVRTSADAQAYDSHRWVADQGRTYPSRPALMPLETAELGIHFHFFLVNQSHWLEKYPKLAHEPDVWPCGTDVELPKQCWKRATTTLENSKLAGYFNQWVGLDLATLQQLAADQIVEERNAVEKILEQTVTPVGLNRKTEPSGCASMPVHEAVVWKPPDSFWRDASRTQTEEGTICFSLADISPDQLHGFYGVEYDSGMYFRWAQPEVEIKLQLSPEDYDLAIDSGHLGKIWDGNLKITVNDGPVRVGKRGSNKNVITVRIPRGDFARDGDQQIRLICGSLDTSTWDFPEPRSLGAPISQLTFTPRPVGGLLRRWIAGSGLDTSRSKDG